MTRSGGRHPLLELDPELGRLLSPERLAAARAALVVRVASLPLGAWDVSSLAEVSAANVGLLVLDGVIARETTLEGNVSTELLGPGDLVRPWSLDDSARLVQWQTCLNALTPLHVAVIDQAVAARQGAFPEITAVVVDRLEARAQRLSMMQAIAHLNRVDARLEAVLWLLAERWGRMTGDGVVVGLVLSHRALAQLVGARRPSVSTALAGLARRGRVSRREDGTWLLDPASCPTAGTATDGAIRQRRRLVPGGGLALECDDEAQPVPDGDGIDELWSAIESLYETSCAHGEDLQALQLEIAALRRRARQAAAAPRARTRGPHMPATTGSSRAT